MKYFYNLMIILACVCAFSCDYVGYQIKTADSDNDGILDIYESTVVDTDGNGEPDYLDDDADGDGIPDGDECPSFGPNCRDTDGDGIPDYLDGDSDGDGVKDSVELANDADCTPDVNVATCAIYDASDNTGATSTTVPTSNTSGDSDCDGIPDDQECPTGVVCQDTDGDGTPDYMDPADFTIKGKITGFFPEGTSISVSESNSSSSTAVVNASNASFTGEYILPYSFIGIEAYVVNAINAVDSLGNPMPHVVCTASTSSSTGTLAASNIIDADFNCVCGNTTQLAYTSYNNEGTGTMSDPYLIYAPQQFAAIGADGTTTAWGDSINRVYYKQMCDLDLTGITLNKIGTTITPFTGEYNGQMFLIDNATLSILRENNVGLFGSVNSAKIENTVIRNANVTGSENRLGILIGESNSVTVSNVALLDSVLTNDFASSVLCMSFCLGQGGIIGQASGANAIEKLKIDNLQINTFDNGIDVAAVIGISLDSMGSINMNEVAVQNTNIQGSDCVTALHAFSLGSVVHNNVYSKNSNFSAKNRCASSLTGGGATLLEVSNAFVYNNSAEAKDLLGAFMNGLDNTSFISNVFSSASAIDLDDVTPAEEVQGESLVYGGAGSMPTFINFIYDSSQTCVDCDVTPGHILPHPGITAASGVSSLLDGTSPALAAWDFTNVWCQGPGQEPELRNTPFSTCP